MALWSRKGERMSTAEKGETSSARKRNANAPDQAQTVARRGVEVVVPRLEGLKSIEVRTVVTYCEKGQFPSFLESGR